MANNRLCQVLPIFMSQTLGGIYTIGSLRNFTVEFIMSKVNGAGMTGMRFLV